MPLCGVEPGAGEDGAPPGHYKWSSYRATAGQGPVPTFLTPDWVLSQFGKRRTEAQRRYRRFVHQGAGEPSLWGALKGQVLLGTEAFVHRIARHLKGAQDIKEIPRRQRLVHRPSLSALFGPTTEDRARRNRQIRRAHLEHSYSLTEIGRHLDLHYSTVSKIMSSRLCGMSRS